MRLHPAEIIRRNLAGEDLWFLDLSKKNAYFFPGGWYRSFTLAEGMNLLRDFDANEVYCYAPVSENPDADVVTMWIDVDWLNKLECVDEQTARKAHPKMSKRVGEIDKES